MSNHKLTKEDVIKIRERLDKGERQLPIAIDYGVDRSTISAIKSRKYWNG